MTKYEFLKVNQSLLQTVISRGVNIQDTKYLALFDEYNMMIKQNLKGYYIIVYLSEKYKISVRLVYKIIERMKSEVQLCEG